MPEVPAKSIFMKIAERGRGLDRDFPVGREPLIELRRCRLVRTCHRFRPQQPLFGGDQALGMRA
jgi:hypothetical protein